LLSIDLPYLVDMFVNIIILQGKLQYLLIKDLGTSEILSEKISPMISVCRRSLQIPVVCRFVTAEQMGIPITSRYTEAASPVSAVSVLFCPPFCDLDNSYSSAIKYK